MWPRFCQSDTPTCTWDSELELCVVVAVPKGSELLENNVTNLLVLPGAQPDQFHQERPSGSPVQPEWPPWCD